MRNHILPILMPSFLILLPFWSCTDLDEIVYSQMTPDNFLQTDAELLAVVVPVYAGLHQYSNVSPYSYLQELSSDELCMPLRGYDWDDTFVWTSLQVHTWEPTNRFINDAWTDAYGGIGQANATLDLLAQSTSESALLPTFIAEVRFLRAFYYWWLVDLFGGVPIVTDPATALKDILQNSRTEVFEFIVEEINSALPDLEGSFGEGNYGRATKGAANALLATLYLNAQVYTGTAMWGECVAACDAVINSGNYDLMATFDDVFALENEGAANTENIFVVGHLAQEGVGFVRQMITLHYNQLPQSPWNGFAVLADYYNGFDTADARIDQLLVGPQLILGGPNSGQQAYDRNGDSLIFSVEFPLIGATESDGVRILKWPVDPNQNGPYSGNDFAIFRYSHILLAKAEALLMSGTGAPLALVNQVRARNFNPDQPLAYVTREDILDERGFEFLWEGFRRQDLIRTGHFLDAWTLKDASDGPHRKLFPIPQTQLDANPNLEQNPGYL